jgi:hypothetical protein
MKQKKLESTAKNFGDSLFEHRGNILRLRCLKKEFKDSVRNRFDVKFLGPAKWFLQMCIHQHKDKSYTLDQHCYILNT